MSVAGYRTHRPGIYRRRIRIRAGTDWVRADLEDDPHRYGIVIAHDGQRVTAISGHPIRTPWSLCPAATTPLQRLVGMRLSDDPTAVFRRTAPGDQCTHMFDTAGLAVAHAARGTWWRQYDIEAPFWTPDEPRMLRLRRDGEALLEWQVDGRTILAPPRFAGRDWQKMLDWARRTARDIDELEAIVVMRRAAMISNGRRVSLDPLANAADTGHVNGACYVFQDGVADRALRNHGSTRDFTHAPDALLADLDT